jgi:hypothetical protein
MWAFGSTWHLYRVMLTFPAFSSQPMECVVSDVRHTSFGSPHPQAADLRFRMEDRASYPTPGAIIGQIARIITVCLGLGVVARVLVAFTGTQ